MGVDNNNSTSHALISIYEIGKILSSSFNLEKTLNEVLNLLASYMQMRRGMVSLVGESGQLEVVAAAGVKADILQREASRLAGGPVGRVLAVGSPEVLLDLSEEPEYAAEGCFADTLDDEVVSFIGVPVKTNGKAVGVVSVERVWHPSDSTVNFEADVRFLTMVATLIGQTVRLHQSVAKERERLMLEKHLLQKALSNKTTPSGAPVSMDNVVGVSRRMQDVYAAVQLIAPSRTTVLLRGESGTGKELIAKAIHTLSARKDAPFIKVNCAALSETLLESELFGHEKGAFTGATQERKGRFELANHGTLFLDEIGEISPSFQAKLLRVLQEGEFERVGGTRTIKIDVRMITATNRDLEAMVARGDFRSDLYYRINVVPIVLPPLRDRKEDIPPLAEHFLKQFNKENSREVTLAPQAMDVLMHCHFPGNVRELENCVNRVATMTRGNLIQHADLLCQKETCLSAQLWKARSPSCRPIEHECLHAAPAAPAAPAPAPSVPMPRGDAAADELGVLPKRDRLLKAMETAGWVQAKAARLLGLTPRQIGYALKKYDIEVKRL
jgi:Nif-specific regulatory protein